MKYDSTLSHFDIDLKRGAQAELLVTDICRMLADGKGTIEVKRDAWYPMTGRYYVERECRGHDGVWRPSGIQVTRATFWGFVYGGHPAMMIVLTDWLKRAVLLAIDPLLGGHTKNNEATCDYGKNPTRGVYVYERHILKARDLSLDEH
jgi:hypothetical protein